MKELIVKDEEAGGRVAMIQRLEQAGFDLRQPYHVERVTDEGKPARKYTQDETDV